MSTAAALVPPATATAPLLKRVPYPTGRRVAAVRRLRTSCRQPHRPAELSSLVSRHGYSPPRRRPTRDAITSPATRDFRPNSHWFRRRTAQICYSPCRWGRRASSPPRLREQTHAQNALLLTALTSACSCKYPTSSYFRNTASAPGSSAADSALDCRHHRHVRRLSQRIASTIDTFKPYGPKQGFCMQPSIGSWPTEHQSRCRMPALQ